MTSLSPKKRRTTRPSILHNGLLLRWRWASLALAATLAGAVPVAQAQSGNPAGSATVTVDDFEPTSGSKPPAKANVTPETRARWEKMHREWLEKKGQLVTPTSPRSTSPVARRAAPQALPAEADNPFEESSPIIPSSGTTTPRTTSPRSTPRMSRAAQLLPTRTEPQQTAELPATPTRVSRVPSGNNLSVSPRIPVDSPLPPLPVEPGTPVFRSQKGFPDIDTSISPELARVLQDVQQQTRPDNTVITPPVRSPGELPKITDIKATRAPLQPNPERQTPESNPQSYVELGDAVYHERVMPEFSYMWEPTNAFSQPLYFEDPVLERYGHTYHPVVQAPVSLGKFAVQLVGLPYQMALHRRHKKMYHLGWYNTGDYVPYRIHQVPLNAKAAAAEAIVILGAGAATP